MLDSSAVFALRNFAIWLNPEVIPSTRACCVEVISLRIAAVVPGFAELARAPLDWHDFAADSGPALGSVDFAFTFLVEVAFVISVSVLFVSAAEFLSIDLE